jgi:hypothetical protein
MKTMLRVCLFCALALALTRAMSAPVAGTWEGKLNGLKAVTLKIQEADGKIQVQATFYIIRDKDTPARHVGEASEAPRAEGHWDGSVLRFAITTQSGKTIPFEMTLSRADHASLRRLPANGEPEMTVPLDRIP